MNVKSHNNLIVNPKLDKLLQLAQFKIEELFQRNNNEITIARRLANIYRQRGLLEKAKAIYSKIVSMDGIIDTDKHLYQIFRHV